MTKDPDYFEKWLKSTLTPLVKPHWIERKRMAEYQASPGCNGSTFLFDTTLEMKQAAERLPEINYAFALGDAFHIATLEPDRFDATDGEQEFFQFSVTRTLDTKANMEAFAADPSRPIVTQALIDKARYMRDAVMKNHLAKRLLSAKADTELSGYVWDNDVQVIKKIRIDFRPKNGNFLLDLKSCMAVNERRFWSDVVKHKYAAKAAYYLDCEAEISNTAPRPLFYFIAVQGPKAENKGPKDEVYMARVFEVASPVSELSLVEQGRAFYRDRLAKFGNAARTNTWEGYEHESEPFVLTTFAPRSIARKQPEDDES